MELQRIKKLLPSKYIFGEKPWGQKDYLYEEKIETMGKENFNCFIMPLGGKFSTYLLVLPYGLYKLTYLKKTPKVIDYLAFLSPSHVYRSYI